MTAATATDAPAFVLVSASNEELGRYTTKGSANRAGKRHDGATVVPAAEWDEQGEPVAVEAVAPVAPEAEVWPACDGCGDTTGAHIGGCPEYTLTPQPEAEVAAPAPAEPKAPKAPKGPTAADERLAQLKANARKLTLPERRALALRVHQAVRASLDALEADLAAGALADGPLADVTAGDLEVCVGNWMWHVPQGGATWGENR